MIYFERVTRASQEIVDLVNVLYQQQSPGKPEITADVFEDALANKNFYLILAKEIPYDGVIQSIFLQKGFYVGMASVFIQRNISGWLAELHDIVVDQNHRGKGIGEELVKMQLKIIGKFASQNQQKVKVFLTSNPSRVAANALYKKVGFNQVATACGPEGTNLYKMVVEP